MTNGILIFAHNNKDVDYALMSIVSGSLAKKYLQVPASLITDPDTIQDMKKSKIYSLCRKTFENIIEIDKPKTNNYRILNTHSHTKTISFINSNRYRAFELTPYQQTLLLDSDFLIFSDNLSKYWNTLDNVMIAASINDIVGNRIGVLDKWVSEVGIHLYWATTVMFKKNEESKIFFNLIKNIQENYYRYADLFRFNPNQYRNDISFSIAKHIMNGFERDVISELPSILTTYDKDYLFQINKNSLKFVLDNNNQMSIATVSNTDIHIMNKLDIIKNADKILDLI